jgi:hypothetical protein
LLPLVHETFLVWCTFLMSMTTMLCSTWNYIWHINILLGLLLANGSWFCYQESMEAVYVMQRNLNFKAYTWILENLCQEKSVITTSKETPLVLFTFNCIHLCWNSAFVTALFSPVPWNVTSFVENIVLDYGLRLHFTVYRKNKMFF